MVGFILFLVNGVFAHTVQDSLFEKALDAESAGDVVLTIALLEKANAYQGRYNEEIQEILDSYYEVLRLKAPAEESGKDLADSSHHCLNWLARLELVGIKYEEYGDSLGADEYSGEAFLHLGAEYEIRRGAISHFLMLGFASDVFMREDSTVFDTSRWAFTPSLEYTIQSERFVVSLGGDVNISERDGAVFSASLSAERDFYTAENFRAGVSGFGYLNDVWRARAKLGGYLEYRPQYGFWTNLGLSGRFDRDTSVSAYFWHYTGMNDFWPESEESYENPWGSNWGSDTAQAAVDSVRERYYLGNNVKVGPELRLQLGYRFNPVFSLDFLGILFWSYDPYADEWKTFVDEFEGEAGWQTTKWNRQMLQGSLRLRASARGKHFGTYLSVGTYFRRYLGLPSGHPEIYSYAYSLGEIRLGTTFRF